MLWLAGCGASSTQPAATAPPPQPAEGQLAYFGGPVMASMRAYVIFWIPRGHRLEPLESDSIYESIVKRYLTDVGGSKLYALLGQYSKDASGHAVFDGPIKNHVTLGGTFVDRRRYPHPGSMANPLTRADLNAELLRVIHAHHWPTNMTIGYFILTADQTYICDSAWKLSCTFRTSPNGGAWCGVHDVTPTNTGPVIYAIIPDALTILCEVDPNLQTDSPDNDPYADAILPILSHEQFEMVTDPTLDAWFTLAPIESEEAFAEVADKCEQNFGSIDSVHANVLLKHHAYQLQEMWSNKDGGCTMGG